VEIPTRLLGRLEYVLSYVGSCNEWTRIRKEIIKSFKPSDRKLFQRRHETTRKVQLNSFDRALMRWWEGQTGVTLWVDQTKLHPLGWVKRRP
jgi:hypothetical protein